MALVVTASSSSADSYATVVEFKAYCDNVGHDYSSYTDEQIEQAMRRGAQWLDATYGARFIGNAAEEDQALEWPRELALYRGEYLSSTVVPTKVKNAQNEAAWRELVEAGSLAPDYVRSETVKSEQVGPLATTYANTRGLASDVIPLVPVVDGLLFGLINGGAGLFGTTARS